MSTALPQSGELKDLLSGLLGRGVTVTPQPAPMSLSRAAVVAEYADDSAAIGASCALDLDLGAAIGAALTMLPAQRVADMTRAGILSDDVAENVFEVLNVAASLFNTHGERHLALRAMHRPPEEPSPEIVEFAVRAGTRVDLRVDVEEYGGGTWVGLMA